MPARLSPLERVYRAETEREFQSKVLKLAKLRGWLVYHTFDSRRSQPGFPDLVLVRGDRLLFCELKRQTGKVEPEQQEWLDALSQVFIEPEVYVWRPSDWAEVDETLA